MINILDQDFRKEIVSQINSIQNKTRKALSLKQYEIYQDRMFQYVKEELRKHFSEDTVNEMPIASFINFPRRIVNNLSSVYKSEPKRNFQNVSEEERLLLERFYEEREINEILKRANRFLNLQDQTHIYIAPDRFGKLKIKNILSHQIDVIPDPQEPETAYAYILSIFNQDDFLTYEFQKSATGILGKGSIGTSLQEIQNAKISSRNDKKKKEKVYLYWDRYYNFLFNESGEIVDHTTFLPKKIFSDEDILSPIEGQLPIIDIAREKDSSYFVRPAMSIIDFGVQYNAAFSDVWHIARMQGYSVAILKGPEELMPETLRIGPNYLLRLKTNSVNGGIMSQGDIDFKFASPSPDIASSIKLLETMLINFISSRGIDPKEIATEGQKTYNSALERLIAMVDRFEASKDDFKIFRNVENKIFNLIKTWVNSKTPSLENEFIRSLSEDSFVSIEFQEPQMIQTKEEKLSYWQKRIDLGLASKIDALADLENISREEAKEKIALINEENSL